MEDVGRVEGVHERKDSSVNRVFIGLLRGAAKGGRSPVRHPYQRKKRKQMFDSS